MDANVPKDERHICVRQSRVVLAPRRWRQVREMLRITLTMVARKPGHQGEPGISRKAIAQGMPDCLRFTCMLVCVSLMCKRHARPRVQRAPGIPCALLVGEGKDFSCLGRNPRRGNDSARQAPSLRAKRSNPFTAIAARKRGLLRRKSLVMGSHSRDHSWPVAMRNPKSVSPHTASRRSGRRRPGSPGR